MDFGGWSNAELEQRCREETSNYLKHVTHDERYCFELFRRALEKKDQDAFTAIYKTYEPLVRKWVRSHQLRDQVDETDLFFVSDSFTNFWKSFNNPNYPDKFKNFSRVAALLNYLNSCVYSCITEYWKSNYLEEQLVSLEDELDRIRPMKLHLDGAINSQQLWDYITQLLPNEQLRDLALAVFILEYKPADIAKMGGWKDARDVSIALQRIKRILRRDATLRQLLEANLSDSSDDT